MALLGLLVMFRKGAKRHPRLPSQMHGGALEHYASANPFMLCAKVILRVRREMEDSYLLRGPGHYDK